MRPLLAWVFSTVPGLRWVIFGLMMTMGTRQMLMIFDPSESLLAGTVIVSGVVLILWPFVEAWAESLSWKEGTRMWIASGIGWVLAIAFIVFGI